MKRKIIDEIAFEGYTLIEDRAKISEAFKDEVNNSRGAILAIVKGKHFCPGGTSRNHRWYPPELWTGVKNDENFMARLKRNAVVGRVGHEPEITDEDIGEGKFSHFTRNINWETGEAESVIIDTPMGRNLLTCLRAGIVLFVSSRATGDYKGKTESGDDIMDPDTYCLERFDFVQDPGFLEAQPSLVSESLNKDGGKMLAVESLLRIAQALKTPLFLDGRDYMVESMDKSGAKMETADTHICESYTFEDFEFAIPALEKSIIKAFKNEDHSELVQDLKIARFANENGLDESYVRRRLDEGATFDMIAKEHIVHTPEFKIAEANGFQPKRTKSRLERILS